MKEKVKVPLLAIDETNDCWNEIPNMRCFEYFSILENLRMYATEVGREAPEQMRQNFVLEQQISELIKNAMIHGNKMQAEKKVRVYFSFMGLDGLAKLVVESEVCGFENAHEWNDFVLKRENVLNDMSLPIEERMKYLNFESTANDCDGKILSGGNALLASPAYWNLGVTVSIEKKRVCAMRSFAEQF